MQAMNCHSDFSILDVDDISIHVPQVGHDSKQSQKLLAKNISTDKSVNSSPHN